MTVRINGHDNDHRILEPGSFLYSSWGYDQTNADFYKVVKRTPKMVTIVQVYATMFEDTDRLAPTDSLMLFHDGDCPTEWTHENRGEWATHAREKSTTCWVPRYLRRKVHSYTDLAGEYHESVHINSFAGAWPYVGGGIYDTHAAGLPGH